MQRNLPEMILKLIEMASDVKKEVKEQVKIAFGEICATITNVDILPIIDYITAAYCDPVKLTEKALDHLIGTTFINDVDLPTLGKSNYTLYPLSSLFLSLSLHLSSVVLL